MTENEIIGESMNRIGEQPGNEHDAAWLLLVRFFSTSYVRMLKSTLGEKYAHGLVDHWRKSLDSDMPSSLKESVDEVEAVIRKVIDLEP